MSRRVLRRSSNDGSLNLRVNKTPGDELLRQSTFDNFIPVNLDEALQGMAELHPLYVVPSFLLHDSHETVPENTNPGYRLSFPLEKLI